MKKRITIFLSMIVEIRDDFAHFVRREVVGIIREDSSLVHVIYKSKRASIRAVIHPISTTKLTDVGPHRLKRDARCAVVGDHVRNVHEVCEKLFSEPLKFQLDSVAHFGSRSDTDAVRTTSMEPRQGRLQLPRTASPPP